MEVIGLFPTPVLVTKLDREFTTEEITEFAILRQKGVQRASGSFKSSDSLVLNRPMLSSLKQDLINAFNLYLDEVIKVSEKVEPLITQSWLNWQKGIEETHLHAHPNSYLSAVLYLETAEDDKIEFYDQRHKAIQLEPKTFDMYNSPYWWVGVKTRDIVIFPSNLVHGVSAREEDKETRVSLAVNMFPTGILGSKEGLTELNIKGGTYE